MTAVPAHDEHISDIYKLNNSIKTCKLLSGLVICDDINRRSYSKTTDQ